MVVRGPALTLEIIVGNLTLFSDPDPFLPRGSLALQKRHAQAHQVVAGIPMHHVLAAIDNVEVDLWLLFLEQFGAFAGVCTVFAAKDHQ
jgi:hypothetical protein